MLVLMVGKHKAVLGGAQQAACARGRGGTPRRRRPPTRQHHHERVLLGETQAGVYTDCRLYGEECYSSDG
jgi:hypothetical protein